LPGFARKSEALSSKSEVIMQNKPNFGKADEGFYGFFRETAIYDIDLRGKMA
jgi:hypothetical protein